MANINILNKKECSGCSVCYKVCPHDAIEMQETKEGFLHPIVNGNKCTDCNVCVKRCHALNESFNDYPEIYSLFSKDKDVLMSSSSGGAFSVLANYFLEKGGYVCGAAFNKDWSVEHIIIDNKNDLLKLQGSKYVESNASKSFDEIKRLLNDGKLVLFSGCPCHVASLLLFLNKKYDNLLTVDIFCHGVSTDKVWQKYLTENHNKNDIKYISFRDKKIFGWSSGIYINKLNSSEYISKNDEDNYMNSYLEYFSCKYECLKCKYKNIYRVSDISIGDYWELLGCSNDGISIILVNTKNGRYILNVIRLDETVECKKEYYEYPNNNAALNIGTFTLYGNMKYFYDNLDKVNFNKLVSETLDIKNNVGLVTMCFQNNYGAILASFALHKIVEVLGYNPILIFPKYMYERRLWKEWSIDSNYNFGLKFAKKYLNVSEPFNSLDDTLKLNNICDTFIVGSDVIWGYFWEENLHFNMLSFTSNDKKRISYSSSFGLDSFPSSYKDILISKYYLNRFDRISVREDTGVDLCKNIFNVEATHVLDPVFLLSIDYYDELIEKSKLNILEDIGMSYIVRTGRLEEKENIINYISNKMNLRFNNVILKERISNFSNMVCDLSVEDWLYMIKKSNFVIADSFHGLCFSIIYNKDFVFINEYKHKNDNRIYSLLKMFGLEDRIIYEYDIEKIDVILSKNINYELVNKKLKYYIDLSLNYLKESFTCEKKKYNESNDDLLSLLIRDSVEFNYHYNRNKAEYKYMSDNWIKLFGIYNNMDYLFIYIFGIKISLKLYIISLFYNNKTEINKLQPMLQNKFAA